MTTSSVPGKSWLPVEAGEDEGRQVQTPSGATASEESVSNESFGDWARLVHSNQRKIDQNTAADELGSLQTPRREQIISLTEVLRIAGQRGLPIEAARQRAAGADADTVLAKSRFYPTLSPRVDYYRHSGRIQNTQGDILDVYKWNTYAGAGVNLSAEPVADWFRVRSAEQRSLARGQEIDLAANDTLRAAAERYFTLVGTYAERSIATADVTYARELLEIAEARESAGSGLPSDVLRARARLAESQSRASRAAGEVGAASARLAEILLLDDVELLVPEEAYPEPIAFVPPTSSAELLDQAYAQRPDLRAAGFDLRASSDQLSAANSWLYPSIRAEANVGAFGANFGELKDRQSYGVGIEWTFGPSLRAKRSRALADEGLSRTRVELIRRRIAAEVNASLERVAAARVAREAADRSFSAAEEGLKLARVRFEQGDALLLEVIDFRSAVIRSESARINAVLDYNRAQLDLLYAVGGPPRDRGTP